MFALCFVLFAILQKDKKIPYEKKSQEKLPLFSTGKFHPVSCRTWKMEARWKNNEQSMIIKGTLIVRNNTTWVCLTPGLSSWWAQWVHWSFTKVPATCSCLEKANKIQTSHLSAQSFHALGFCYLYLIFFSSVSMTEAVHQSPDANLLPVQQSTPVENHHGAQFHLQGWFLWGIAQ